jgi:hypothetical protein
LHKHVHVWLVVRLSAAALARRPACFGLSNRHLVSLPAT